MLLLLVHDLADGFDGRFICGAERINLMTKMAQDNALDRYGSGCDGATTEQARAKAQHETSEPAEMKAAASANTAALKLSLKNGSMPALVRLKLGKFTQQTPRGEPCNEELTSIDVDCAMLTSVVDLEDPFAKVLSGAKTCAQLHDT